MKRALQLPKTVLALEAVGILLLILAFLLVQHLVALPVGWSGRRIATALILPALS